MIKEHVGFPSSCNAQELQTPIYACTSQDKSVIFRRFVDSMGYESSLKPYSVLTLAYNLV